MQEISTDDALRSKALASLKKKSDFRTDVMAYIIVNAMLVAIWAVTGAPFFWPIFPIVGWGVGVIFHAMDTYRREPSEEQIRREMDRMR